MQPSASQSSEGSGKEQAFDLPCVKTEEIRTTVENVLLWFEQPEQNTARGEG